MNAVLTELFGSFSTTGDGPVEGSKLSEEKSIYIYKTNTFFTKERENSANKT